MSFAFYLMVVVFVFGYLCIALEHPLKTNKTATALVLCTAMWSIVAVGGAGAMTPAIAGAASDVRSYITEGLLTHLGETGEIVFFLLGAMTIVEIVDRWGGFRIITDKIHETSKVKLLWILGLLTFFMSAVLDNLTTTIVMLALLGKLVPTQKERWFFAGMIVLAANAGGVWSPIGDVTTIMLWNKGLITAAGVISEILLPSIVSMVIPALIIQLGLKGNLDDDNAQADAAASPEQDLSDFQRKVVFWVGVGGLVFVPVFKSLTHLPPFVGILLVLSVLWIVTEVFYAHLKTDKGARKKRVVSLIRNIDMSTILFFLGILMAVSCLEEIGALTSLGKGLNVAFDGNHFMVTGIIGVLSSIVDNVPLVAGCMGMYPVQAVGDFATDGVFWQLLAYCAGVGGSMLIIGSAAGVVVMGLEKITFGWYMKHVSWIAFVGYVAGILCYYVLREFIFTTPL